jgi:hypothetical protein
VTLNIHSHRSRNTRSRESIFIILSSSSAGLIPPSTTYYYYLFKPCDLSKFPFLNMPALKAEPSSDVDIKPEDTMANGDDKPRLTEVEKKANHIASGELAFLFFDTGGLVPTNGQSKNEDWRFGRVSIG